MTPDDPRHGTHRGYVIGCRLTCCTTAHCRYMKLYRMGRIPHLMDPVGTVRRIRALQALGWTYAAIGEHCGKGENWAYMIPRSPQVVSTTAARIAAAYDDLCMVVPVGRYAERTRRLARRKGWAPPLAWEDIDDPNEVPDMGYVAQGRSNQTTADVEVDRVVVDRILAGDKVHATPAERREVARRWAADGRSVRDLERLTGWKVERYFRARDAA